MLQAPWFDPIHVEAISAIDDDNLTVAAGLRGLSRKQVLMAILNMPSLEEKTASVGELRRVITTPLVQSPAIGMSPLALAIRGDYGEIIREMRESGRYTPEEWLAAVEISSLQSSVERIPNTTQLESKSNNQDSKATATRLGEANKSNKAHATPSSQTPLMAPPHSISAFGSGPSALSSASTSRNDGVIDHSGSSISPRDGKR